MGNLFHKLDEEHKNKIFEQALAMLEPGAKDHICGLIHVALYGEHLSDEDAKRWVSKMVNKDGTHGEHFTWDRAKSLREDFRITNATVADFYAVINMLRSDYYDVLHNDIEGYIKMARDWFGDADASEGKTYRYYKYISK